MEGPPLFCCSDKHHTVLLGIFWRGEKLRKDNELVVLLAVDRTAKISGRGAFQLNKEDRKSVV